MLTGRPGRRRPATAAALTGLALALAALAYASASGCRENGNTASQRDPGRAQPTASTKILEVDGLTFTRGEVDEWFPWLRSVHSRSGRNLLAQYVLNDYLIPLALARREFGPAREEMRRRAEALHNVIGNGGYPELVARGQAHGGFTPHPPPQSAGMALPLQRWAFDPENLGQVSSPLETPEGFALISAADIHTSVTRLEDTAELFVVPFYTHTAVAMKSWLDQQRERIADRVTYVHPEWRDAMPPWLRLPSATSEPPPPK